MENSLSDKSLTDPPHDDFLDLLQRIENRTKPMKWLWAILLAICAGAFVAGSTYADIKTDLRGTKQELTIVKLGQENDRNESRKLNDANIKALNEIAVTMRGIQTKLDGTDETVRTLQGNYR